MQIELIGCTGAGKSTFARKILRSCEASEIKIESHDVFLLKKVRLNWIENYIVRTLTIDVIAMFGCLLAVWYHRRLIFFFICSAISTPGNIVSIRRINLMRNVLKKIGLYELLRLMDEEERFILVDEGTIHAAHNLYVHENTVPDFEGLIKFIEMVPVPALAIRIDAERSVLIDRVLKRGHRRISLNTKVHVERFIDNAETVFDHVVKGLTKSGRMCVMYGRPYMIGSRSDIAHKFMDVVVKNIET